MGQRGVLAVLFVLPAGFWYGKVGAGDWETNGRIAAHDIYHYRPGQQQIKLRALSSNSQ